MEVARSIDYTGDDGTLTMIGPGLLIFALAALSMGRWNDAQGAVLTSTALVGVVVGCLESLRS